MKRGSRTNRFKRDVKKMKKRGKSFDVFKLVIQKLAHKNSSFHQINTMKAKDFNKVTRLSSNHHA